VQGLPLLLLGCCMCVGVGLLQPQVGVPPAPAQEPLVVSAMPAAAVAAAARAPPAVPPAVPGWLPTAGMAPSPPLAAGVAGEIGAYALGGVGAIPLVQQAPGLVGQQPGWASRGLSADIAGPSMPTSSTSSAPSSAAPAPAPAASRPANGAGGAPRGGKAASRAKKIEHFISLCVRGVHL
jgi:hypothetical protein